MLKGIDPLIHPELLFVLARMGHGDELVISDANFPSASTARHTVHPNVLQMACPSPIALRAVLSVMPVDGFQPDPVVTMQVVGDPAAVPPPVAEAAAILATIGVTSTGLERFAFYDRARQAFAVLRTAETRSYGNFIIRKGVV